MKPETKSLFPEADWFGLIVDNRHLFDALQDGWLRPVASETGLFVGVDSFVQEPTKTQGNQIPVRVRIDTDKLPDLHVHVFRDHNWQALPRSQVAATESCVYWPGSLPTFAIRDLGVTSEEHRVRLMGMARLASNITVPDVVVSNASNYSEKHVCLPSVSPPKALSRIVSSNTEDSIRGAMTMALWAIPRIDLWMDVLVASLSSNAKKLAIAASTVKANWWRFPPWMPEAHSIRGDNITIKGAQEHLWLAAIEAFKSRSRLRSSEIAERISGIALMKIDCPDEKSLVEDWIRTTQKVLSANTSIRHDNWRSMPVGLAIQLVLTRPEPARFKSWLCDDDISLPPAVAWSAAALCGLFHGFRRLDTYFRGPSSQQEIIAIQAMRMCSEGTEFQWPSMTDDEATWRRESENFILQWAGRDFVSKRQKERGQWFASNFNDPAVQRSAVSIAKHFNWPCVSRFLNLEAGRRHWDGPGEIENIKRTLKVHGGRIRLRLEQPDRIEERVDQRDFLHMTAIEPGRMPGPPVSTIPMRSVDDIPGFKLLPDFLSEAEEKSIVAEIDRCQWNTELQRHVQHYGWRYDYESKQVDSTMRLGRLPEWAEAIAKRLFESGHLPEMPDQVIVNKYIQDQGIAPHIDNPSSFADGVATISLLETWEMDFRKRNSKLKVARKLDRRSAAVLTGEARYEWTHSIPKRKTEPVIDPDSGKKKRFRRKRRISLTFRKVIGSNGNSHLKNSASA